MFLFVPLSTTYDNSDNAKKKTKEVVIFYHINGEIYLKLDYQQKINLRVRHC